MNAIGPELQFYSRSELRGTRIYSSMPYSTGFQDVEETNITSLEWEGSPPDWLRGTLFRNGPGRYNRGEVEVSHWFDGLALLHGFKLSPQGVQYHSRFIRSLDFRTSEDEGTIAQPGFACDPCRSLFRKLASAFVVDATDNPNVSLVKQGDRFLALTELPIPMEFDPRTLRSRAPHLYKDSLPPGSTTAHPHQEGQRLFNQVLHYSALSSYRLYYQDGLAPRQEYGRVKVGDVSYVHSFGLTENHTILTCCPFQVAPWKLLVRDRPFIENFSWKPDRGTRFHIVPRPGKSGDIRTFRTEPFFCFHHVNSFEVEDKLFVDLVAYDTSEIIEQLRLHHLRGDQAINFGKLRRYEVDLGAGTISRLWESKHNLELSRIRYQSHNTKPYRYVWGVSAVDGESQFYDRIVKLDVETDEALYWSEPETYPGEPIFIAAPGSKMEDEGLLLSVVLNGESVNSYLVVLDSKDLKELARCTLPLPIPHGFHGLYEGEQS